MSITSIDPKIFVERKSVRVIGTINCTDNYHSPSNLSFQSPQSIGELKTIRLIYDTPKKSITVFGGQDVKITEKIEENKYEVDSHERRLNGKITKVFTNQTTGQILKWVCKQKKVKVGKFAKTTKKHPKLAFEAKKAIDICHQVATLEDNMLFKVNVDGLAELKKIPAQEKGYVFNLTNVTDYELSHDYSDVITGVKVYGEKNKELYSYNNKSMVAKYGVITDIIDDDNIKSKSDAKAKATALFKEKKNPVFSGSITLPGILHNLKAGMWCSFKGANGKYHNYWIGTVATTISNSERSQKLTLYDGKPAPPSDWIYTPPNDNNLENCTEKTVSNPQTIQGSCGTCGKGKSSEKAKGKVSFEDKCTHPSCKNPNKGLSFNPKKTKEGEWTCKACGADYCAKCGKEKIKGSKVYLNKSTSCKAAKGVPQVVANKANELKTPRACWNHVKNFHYEYYMCDNKKKGLEKTLSDKAGNCYDLNNLFKYMCRQLGYTAHVQCGHKCGSSPHCVCYVTINGQKWLVDCTCKRQFVKAK